MTLSKTYRAAILGASGYTGADLLRLGIRHPHIEFVALTAERHAGSKPADIWPHLFHQDLPLLESAHSIDWSALQLDVLFCCLPHATTQELLLKILSDTGHSLVGGDKARFKIIDLSADFRLRDIATYQEWYASNHQAPDLQKKAVYGLTELYRSEIREADLIACPGCYPTAALLALVPLVKAGLIDPDDIRIDAKSGVTGAGRSLKETNLFTEVADAMHPYGLTGHRHTPEIEQEIAVAANRSARDQRVSFIPHLIPMNRGELETISVRLMGNGDIDALKNAWCEFYEDEPFVHVLEGSKTPATRSVRGSNHCVMNAYADRRPGFATVVVTLDNLVKGSSGQAMQNFNCAFGLPEATALQQLAMFP